MRLYNPNPNKKKTRAYIAVQWILIVLIVVGAIVESVMFDQVVYDQLGDMVWGILLGSYVVGVVFIIIICVAFGKALKKTQAYVDLHAYGIGRCECGKLYDASEIQWKIDENSLKTTVTETDMKTETETYGDILIECTCRQCGLARREKIHHLKLGDSYAGYKRVWFTTNSDPTFSYKERSNTTAVSELEKQVLLKYQYDRSHADVEIMKYKQLGYRETP